VDGRGGAFVVHATPQRIRIKIPRWQRRHDNFAVLQRALESRAGVLCVRVNLAGIVINCSDGFEIASVRDCFAGLELTLAVDPCTFRLTCPGAANRPRSTRSPRFTEFEFRRLYRQAGHRNCDEAI
jgi:hypothetical protein